MTLEVRQAIKDGAPTARLKPLNSPPAEHLLCSCLPKDLLRITNDVFQPLDQVRCGEGQ